MRLEDTEKALLQRFPEALALIVSKDVKGKVNLCPIGYFSLVTWEPKVWAVAIYKSHYSTKIIKDTNEFVLCLPAIQQVKDVLYCGSVHGWTEDKTKRINLKFIKSKKVKPPIIEGSIACFECKVIGKIKIEDHTLFLGKIVESYCSEKNWQDKIYNWDDKSLGIMQFGKKSMKISYSPQQSTKES